jgi:ribonuclease R
MAKAIYTTDNIGHYGLAFEFYSHFTSPIRRYSDVLTHRILEKNIGENVYREKKGPLEEKCVHISAQERKAMTAERESIKYKQVEFIMDHVGEVFEGRISGMIDRGIFVELVESRCEGMVGFDTLHDNYELAESRLRAVGRRTKQVFKMGDIVKVKILDANLDKREIEMELVEE